MVKRLLIANGVVYLAQMISPPLTSLGALASADVMRGYLWQPFTYMWLHAPGQPFHIIFNMFALWMFGGMIEQVWGSRRFLQFYLTCGVGAGVVIFFANFFTNPYIPTLGASGAVYGILTAFSLMWPDRTIMLLFPPIPIKAIWFIPVLFLMQLLWGAHNISHAGHLGGVLVAAFIMRDELRRYFDFSSLRFKWHRYRMRHRLRAVRREDQERRQKDDDDPPRTFH
jgi:membrane associated rhomboid family serine protease